MVNSRIIGERLKEVREKKQISQTAIAKELGITQAAYCQFEKGRKIPNTMMLSAMSEVFEVSADYLLGKGE